MNHPVLGTVMLAQLVDLGVAIMACSYAVVCLGRLDLLIFYASIFQTGLLEAGLKESTAPATAEVIRAIGLHIDEILFPHHRPDHIAKILGDGIPIAFPNNLARVLNGKLDLEFFVPIRAHLELALADPLGVIFINAFDFKLMRDIELFQSCQDREGDVPSLGIEKCSTPQIVRLLGRSAGNLLPSIVISQEHAVVFAAPPF